ncbi:MAG TPA: hypothetical protein VHU92_21365, partial [Streptosporangiaceae bacterium]|nr:hypothetical protein [Streptosporangiaceae bacterium]
QAAHATAVGVGGDLGAEPISFERFVEIQTAQGAAAQRGYDANAVLAHFGMTALDWSNAGMFWSKRIQQDPMKYHQLMTEYREFYEAKYAG